IDPSGAQVARRLAADGFAVYAGHLDARARPYTSLPTDRPVALLFGNEHEGPSDETLGACTGTFRIPMAGFTQSFNVSVAAEIARSVQRYYERIKDFSATFAQTSTYPTFGNVTKASGKVFLKKPDLLRWQYDDGRLIVLDGKKLWNWNPEDKEVQVKSGFGP